MWRKHNPPGALLAPGGARTEDAERIGDRNPPALQRTISESIMQPDTLVSLKRTVSPGTAAFRKYLVQALTLALIGCMYLLLPLLPLLASLAFFRSRYVVQYRRTLKKMLIHLKALSEGPVHHYFQDVVGRQTKIPAEIRGECTQCGNCCLDKRCVFLEKTADDKYLCGIYHSPLRRFSNCGSFPLSVHDIERYACPGYTVVREAPIHWVHPALISK